MNIVYDGSMDKLAFKDIFSTVIPEILETDPDAIYLDADLMSCIGTAKYGFSHPDRAVNCGVAEANMIGVACGMAAAGFKPIVHTFGIFASRRVFDQVFLSAGYAKNALTIIGSDPGVTAAYNGGTHMPFEDIGLYRTLPGAIVLEATDTTMLADLLHQCKDMPGVKYIRAPRKTSAKVYEDGSRFKIGKGIALREGKDAVVFACGILVHEAMQAAEALSKEGIEISVVDLFTIKPLDVDIVAEYAKKTGAAVTAENHNRYGGLFSAVSEAIALHAPVPMEYVAVEDEFGEVGPQSYLQERFGLTKDNIVKKVKLVLARK